MVALSLASLSAIIRKEKEIVFSAFSKLKRVIKITSTKERLYLCFSHAVFSLS